MRNTGGNKYETTAGEIQFDQFSTFFEKPKMTSRKVTPTAVNVKVKKILTTFSCPLACVGTNLAAICPMEVHLPSEKLVLPYFSSPRGVAILDCDSHSQAGSTTFKGIVFRGILVLLFSFTYWQYISIWIFLQIFIQYLYWQLLETFLCLVIINILFLQI